MNNTQATYLEELKASQQVARDSVKEVEKLIQPGWSEYQTAKLLEEVLKDFGVQSFFHKPFAWFGPRTCFQGIWNYWQFQPKKSKLLEETDVVVLDVAPIYKQTSCDIGYAFSLQENAGLVEMKQTLREIRNYIPQLFSAKTPPKDVWKKVDQYILDKGYTNIHKRYPLQVLGHRLYTHPSKESKLSMLHFGLEAYKSLLSKGVLSEVLSPMNNPDIQGVWAIEPHLGNGQFGAKFEEVLVVDKDQVYWLDEEFI